MRHRAALVSVAVLLAACSSGPTARSTTAQQGNSAAPTEPHSDTVPPSTIVPPSTAVPSSTIVASSTVVASTGDVPLSGGECLANAAVCETFEGGVNGVGNRNGDLSVDRFSVSRWRSELGQSPQAIGAVQAPACRAGAVTNALPPGDVLICDPTSVVATHYLQVATAMQNYGDTTARFNQPFDISGRTGAVRFDVSLWRSPGDLGGLMGWPTFEFTSEPYSAPSYQADNSGGPTPTEGLLVHFNDVCPGPSGFSAFPHVRSYHDHTEADVNDTSGQEAWCADPIVTQQGHLNRVEILLSQSHMEIWASDASADGVNFPPLQRWWAGDISLSFLRGYVYFGVHNHATIKYGSLPSWNVSWDNISFDGPVIGGRVTQAADSGTSTLGWWLPNNATGSQPVALPAVNLSGVQSARLVLNMAADQITNTNFSAWRLVYSLNGGQNVQVAMSATEQAQALDRSGSYIWSIPIDLNELSNGTNTVKLSGIGMYGGSQPYFGNVDIVTAP